MAWFLVAAFELAKWLGGAPSWRPSMLERVLETEVMDTLDEARDYDAMDHASVNATFCEDLVAFAAASTGSALGLRAPPRIVDFGTGTALIPIELCKRAEGFSVVAIDLAENMLAIARANVMRAGLGRRITLQRVDAKRTPFPDGAFGAAISNSIVHHIPEPQVFFAEMWRVTAKGGVLFVRDLHRPEDPAELSMLVRLHGGTAPPDPSLLASFDNQRSLFRASLRAALTVGEVAEMIAPLGIGEASVTRTSDRHWTLRHEKTRS